MANVLSQRKFLQKPILIGADIPPHERAVKAVLLHGKWKLELGFDCSFIKCRKLSLFGNCFLYDKFSGSNFQLSPDFGFPNCVTSPIDISSVNPICVSALTEPVDTQPVDAQSESPIFSPSISTHPAAHQLPLLQIDYIIIPHFSFAFDTPKASLTNSGHFILLYTVLSLNCTPTLKFCCLALFRLVKSSLNATQYIKRTDIPVQEGYLLQFMNQSHLVYFLLLQTLNLLQ